MIARYSSPEARAASAAIDAEWMRTFFGPEERPVAQRKAVEAGRIRLRHAYNATRGLFWFLLGPAVPRVRLDVQGPSATEAIYGPMLRTGNLATRLPAELPAIEASWPYVTDGGWNSNRS